MKKITRTTNTGFKESLALNNATYIDYLDRIKQICVSMFEWINLPPSMDPFYLEETLYYFGVASLLYDNKVGFINTKCSTNGYLNIYGKPTKVNCYSFGYQKHREVYYGFKENDNDNNKCILVYNNISRAPTVSTIALFAYRLYEAERTNDVNIKAQKTPVLIITDDKQRLTLENMYSQVDGNKPVIFGDKQHMNGDVFKVLKTDAPFVADKIINYKKEIWNELLTFLGINNIQTDKKERLITEEANTNNELINYNLQNRLSVRKMACKQFNEYFNLKDNKAIDVKIRSDLKNIVKEVESIVNDYNVNTEGSANNGEIYD